MPKKKQVIVTTQYKGTYYGTLHAHDKINRQCVLHGAVMAIHWGTADGVDQLAATGPTKRSKLGLKAPVIWLCGLTHVADCTEKAVAEWDRRRP